MTEHRKKKNSLEETREKNQVTMLPDAPMERKIGNTTYIVRVHYKQDAREGLLDKIWRLIKNDAGDDVINSPSEEEKPS